MVKKPIESQESSWFAKIRSTLFSEAARVWEVFVRQPVNARLVSLASKGLNKALEWFRKGLEYFRRLPFAPRTEAFFVAVLSNRRIVFHFVAINLLILIVTSPVVVFYGPFENIKSAVVGAIITSRHPQYITWLFSDAKIKEIVGSSLESTSPQQRLIHFVKREDTSLRLVNINSARFQGYLLEVPDPTRIKAATSRDIREIGDTVSSIATSNHAVAAINAGGFHDPEGTGTGRLPYGVIVHNSQFLVGGDISGPVQVVGITSQGMLVAGTYTVKEMETMNLAEGVTFGPPLIIDGKKLITDGDGGWGIAPRTAIGQRTDGTILLLVIDGRQPGYSLGATMLDVQNILYEQGAYNAANLDGGSSTTMFYNGKVINKPADMLGERLIPTAFIVE